VRVRNNGFLDLIAARTISRAMFIARIITGSLVWPPGALVTTLATSCSITQLGLAQESRSDYKLQMDQADTPRQCDLDGRGNLSQRALSEFALWFVQVALDQVRFMSGLFELDTLATRFRSYVARSQLKPESARLLEEALMRGAFERGEIARITGLPERSARRVLNDVIETGLLASDTPKGAVSLRFPVQTLDLLFCKMRKHYSLTPLNLRTDGRLALLFRITLRPS
jgi:hypothetical protein